jgi:hypothetical protein
VGGQVTPPEANIEPAVPTRMRVDLDADERSPTSSWSIDHHRVTDDWSASFVLCLLVTTAQETTTFSVELIECGWSVSDGAERLGLFVSQRQALDDVRKRRAALKAKGRASSVEVTGEETEGARRRYGFTRR